jgi:hypothetical protein
MRGATALCAPGQTRLVCDHCGHAQDIPTLSKPPASPRLCKSLIWRKDCATTSPAATVEESAPPAARTAARWWSSGATHATECPFCATPVVLDTGTRRHIKPQALLPFVFTEAEARKAMVAWMGSLWFAPGTLLEYARKGRAMNGVYVPFWTFDADTSSRYSGSGANTTTRPARCRSVNGKSERGRNRSASTRWFPASGRVARDFNDVLVMASRSLPERLGDELTPWDMGDLVPYSP